MIPWTLTGSDTQRAIATLAFNRIKFPFDRLSLPGAPELGWRDLNGSSDWMYEAKARFHGGGHFDKPDTLEGEVNGRRFTLGVIFTISGRIFIDSSLTDEPELAMAVIGAEIAHAVDFFLPMTDEMRNELLRLWGVGGTWWEVSDYGAEYFNLGGEAFMGEFVAAYSDLPFDRSPFLHDAGVEPADVRRILGIERTDYITPQSPPLSPPVPHDHFIRYGKSKVYHRADHYEKKVGEELHDLTGLRPCKVCKP